MSRALRILCVDDDPDIRTIVMMALGLDADIEARSAPSGDEALTMLGKGDWAPHAILLDVMMGEMSGPELLGLIRASGAIADVPVIFLTANAGRAAFETYRALGAAGVIIKPFDPLGLAAEVRALLGGIGSMGAVRS